MEVKLEQLGTTDDGPTASWAVKFIEAARFFAAWSKDPSTRCGAVIVRGKNDFVSQGYNGFPQGMPDDPALLSNRDEKYSRIVHAEINAFIFARRSVEGMNLYTWPFVCCDRCAVQMIQAGIQHFIFPSLPEDKRERWGESMAKSIRYLDERGVKWTEVPESALTKIIRVQPTEVSDVYDPPGEYKTPSYKGRG